METRLLGDVTFYNKLKGFGFLSGSDGRSHFFHIKDVLILEGVKVVPSVGDLFTFQIRPSRQKPGFFEAFDVRLTKRAVPAAPASESDIASDGAVR